MYLQKKKKWEKTRGTSTHWEREGERRKRKSADALISIYIWINLWTPFPPSIHPSKKISMDGCVWFDWTSSNPSPILILILILIPILSTAHSIFHSNTVPSTNVLSHHSANTSQIHRAQSRHKLIVFDVVFDRDRFRSLYSFRTPLPPGVDNKIAHEVIKDERETKLFK